VSRWLYQRREQFRRRREERDSNNFAVTVSVETYLKVCHYADDNNLTLKAALETAVADVGCT
jgi:hypothetical protein